MEKRRLRAFWSPGFPVQSEQKWLRPHSATHRQRSRDSASGGSGRALPGPDLKTNKLLRDYVWTQFETEKTPPGFSPSLFREGAFGVAQKKRHKSTQKERHKKYLDATNRVSTFETQPCMSFPFVLLLVLKQAAKHNQIDSPRPFLHRTVTV